MPQIKDEFAKIENKVQQMVEDKFDISDAELAILRVVLALGQSMLGEFIRMSEEQERLSGPPTDSQGASMQSKGNASRQYLSIFGKFSIIRSKYYSRADKTHYPLDARLNLPRGIESFLLQEWICSSACEKDYRESIELLNRILGLDLYPVQSHRIVNAVGAEVEGFYQDTEPFEAASEGTCLCHQADGKGVRIVESERNQGKSTQSSSDKMRLMKGQKRGVKKMATVSLDFSFDPVPRSPEEMLKSLHKKWSKEEQAAFREQVKRQGEKPREAKNIHKRAFLGGQDKALRYGITNLKERSRLVTAKGEQKPKDIIVLVDAGIGLEQGIKNELTQAKMGDRMKAMILDFIHVSEYVWKVANAYKGEKHKKRLQWVEKQLLKILNGQIKEVIEEFKRLTTRPWLKKSAKESIKKTISYFENHQHKMDYKTYLEKGYPITTGLVEGSCGHLVKERMEGSGMRWSIKGAQNMLDLRATKINGDLAQLFHKIKEDNRTRLYSRVA